MARCYGKRWSGFFIPRPYQGIAIVVGLAAGLANWGVALPLKEPAAIRLAYVHNMVDAYVLLSPVVAGLLVVIGGYTFFDPLIAGGIALWIIWSTEEDLGSHEKFIWPEKTVPQRDRPSGEHWSRNRGETSTKVLPPCWLGNWRSLSPPFSPGRRSTLMSQNSLRV